MLLERYYDESLAQASYMIGCERAGEAIVIDPNVMSGHTARSHRMAVRYVAETHIHADYLCGAREMAKRENATLLLSGHGGTDWSYKAAPDDTVRLVRDGDSIQIGMVRLDVLHTPGHTPEHIAFLVTDLATADRPIGLISGDFVFVGDVGRPDLLEKAAHVSGTMESSAKQLYASLQRLKNLPDYLQIWPGHGAGSACGKALGAVPSTTLGYERLFNPAFQQNDERPFVNWVLQDQPEPPPYFAVMKHRNRDGWSPQRGLDGWSWTPGRALLESIDKGWQVVDLRGSRDYAASHIPGSINIPFGNSLVTYAGTVLKYDTPIVIISAQGTNQTTPALQRFALIGLEIGGFANKDGLDEALAQRKEALQTIDAAGLSKQLATNGPRVIDVRGKAEWNDGHLPTARHIYLGELGSQMSSLKKDQPIVVHCQTGTRSSIAASLLRRAGFADVTNFPGGVAAWVKAGLPLETD